MAYSEDTSQKNDDAAQRARDSRDYLRAQLPLRELDEAHGCVPSSANKLKLQAVAALGTTAIFFFAFTTHLKTLI